jgi:hypothetical protein
MLKQRGVETSSAKSQKKAYDGAQLLLTFCGATPALQANIASGIRFYLHFSRSVGHLGQSARAG